MASTRSSNAAGKDSSGSERLEATHRSKPGFEPTMVGFDRVVRILLGVVHGGRDEFVEGPRIGRCPVCDYLHRHRPGGQRPGEERPRGTQIAPGRQPDVDDLPVLVDRPVQVRHRPLTLT